MEISTRLAAHLAALTRMLDDPSVDLEAELRAFAVRAKAAVSSFLGMSMSIRLDGQQVSFTAGSDRGTDAGVADAAASLLIPLPALIGAEAGSNLVLYAANPGAFVDLAADLAHALQLDTGALVVDEHLGASPAHGLIDTGITGLEEQSVVNQAIGILLDRGHTPESARRELQRLAGTDGRGTQNAAAAIIADTALQR